MGAQLPNSNSTTCKRLDGRNLVTEWQQMRQAEGASYAYLANTKQLQDLDVDNVEYVMGKREETIIKTMFVSVNGVSTMLLH